MKRSLMDILCCPVCKGDLDLNVDKENEKEILEGELHCAACQVDYPIHEGIPNLLPPAALTDQGAGMNLPLPSNAVVCRCGTGDGGYEIYLNRIGINSIDIPREKVLAEPGTGLVLKFLNRGAPIHITITSSNASMFTDFFHENMYIVDEAVLSIPITEGVRGRLFDLEIIAGYGAVKAAMPGQCCLHPAHATEGAGRIPAATGCPWPASSADGYHGDRAYPVLRPGSIRISNCSILLFYHPHCWCTLHMVPSQIALPALVLLAALVVDRLYRGSAFCRSPGCPAGPVHRVVGETGAVSPGSPAVCRCGVLGHHRSPLCPAVLSGRRQPHGSCTCCSPRSC